MTAQLALAISPPPPTRQERLVSACLEASRSVLAQFLAEERRNPRAVRHLAPELLDAMQTLRDCAAAERRAR